MWRPKNWEQIVESSGIDDDYTGEANFERGADAMLEALKQQGEYVDAAKAPHGYVLNKIATYPRTFKGWFVLIPEKDEDEGIHLLPSDRVHLEVNGVRRTLGHGKNPTKGCWIVIVEDE